MRQIRKRTLLNLKAAASTNHLIPPTNFVGAAGQLISTLMRSLGAMMPIMSEVEEPADDANSCHGYHERVAAARSVC